MLYRLSMLQTSELLTEGTTHGTVAVTQSRCDPSHRIKKSTSVLIPDPATRTAFQPQRESL